MKTQDDNLEEFLDEMDAFCVAVAVRGFNRKRRKRTPKDLPDHGSSFHNWVEDRKRGNNNYSAAQRRGLV